MLFISNNVFTHDNYMYIPLRTVLRQQQKKKHFAHLLVTKMFLSETLPKSHFHIHTIKNRKFQKY